MHRKNREKVFFYSLIMITVLCLVNVFLVIFSFPDEINVIQGQSQKLKDSLIFSLVLDENPRKCVNLNSSGNLASSYLLLEGNNRGKVNASLKFLGLLPVKKVTLNVIPDIKVVPSGEAIGVKIESKGVLVVGLSSITDVNGRKCSPAADAGFEVGDKIIEIDKNQVENERDIIDYLNNRLNKKEKITFAVERNGEKLNLSVTPVQCQEDNIYRVGLWIRDNIAGVGTLTFYDTQSKTFGALGHGITDVDSGVLIDISKGKILKSKIASIQKARKTVPGELVGIFYDSDEPYGTIDKNTSYGIYGRLNKNISAKGSKPVSIGLNSQIKEGPAKIMTTIDGNKVEEFDIEIQKVVRQVTSDSKSMIIKVTDPKLIDKTGGIVQGMSGSPILQDGKLIGSITHVLVNDPTRGYGISIEWMLKEANIDIERQMNRASGE
ncbi:MAG: SpoIVB peptidase [Caulobacteraceae bacterium]